MALANIIKEVDPPVELTQAEYDALSTAQKNDGTVYYITDGNGAFQTAATTPAEDTSGGTSNVQDELQKKVEKTDVVNNFTTTQEGYVADARALKTIADNYSLKTDLTDIINSTVKRTHGIIRIPNNADINNYLTEGEYFVDGNTPAQTMTNLPEVLGGRLTVNHSFDETGQYFIQTYITYTGHIYLRTHGLDGWRTNWIKIASQEDLDKTVIYRDLTIEPSTAISIPANGSIYYTNYTTPSVSGYTCVAVSVINQTGSAGGYCIFMPRLITNGITIHNNNNSAASITKLQLRYVFLKN